MERLAFIWSGKQTLGSWTNILASSFISKRNNHVWCSDCALYNWSSIYIQSPLSFILQLHVWLLPEVCDLINMPLFKTVPKFGWYCPNWMQWSRWLQFGAGGNQILPWPIGARITNKCLYFLKYVICITLFLLSVFLWAVNQY